MLPLVLERITMRDVSKMKLLCSSFCKQYGSEAKFYIDEANPSGFRHLVVIYEKGGYGGAREFAAGIPKDWTDQDVLDFILWDHPDTRYPAWEIPARAHGSPMLYRSI
jgi:hypothetical protein